jgi:hypothetical protein
MAEQFLVHLLHRQIWRRGGPSTTIPVSSSAAAAVRTSACTGPRQQRIHITAQPAHAKRAGADSRSPRATALQLDKPNGEHDKRCWPATHGGRIPAAYAYAHHTSARPGRCLLCRLHCRAAGCACSCTDPRSGSARCGGACDRAGGRRPLTGCRPTVCTRASGCGRCRACSRACGACPGAGSPATGTAPRRGLRGVRHVWRVWWVWGRATCLPCSRTQLC